MTRLDDEKASGGCGEDDASGADIGVGTGGGGECVGTGQLAAVPRRGGGRGRRRPRAARALGAGRERRLADRHSGTRLELAHRLGRSRLRAHRHPRQRHDRRAADADRILPGPFARRLDDRRRHRPGGAVAALGALRRRLRDRCGPLGAGSAYRRADADRAPEEHVRVGDPGHRRRAGLRLPGRHRTVRVRLRGQRGVVGAPRVAAAPQLGRGRLADSPRRAALRGQRQRRAVVGGGLRRGDGRGDLAHRPRRGGPTGRRRSSGRTTSAPSS